MHNGDFARSQPPFRVAQATQLLKTPAQAIAETREAARRGRNPDWLAMVGGQSQGGSILRTQRSPAGIGPVLCRLVQQLGQHGALGVAQGVQPLGFSGGDRRQCGLGQLLAAG